MPSKIAEEIKELFAKHSINVMGYVSAKGGEVKLEV